MKPISMLRITCRASRRRRRSQRRFGRGSGRKPALPPRPACPTTSSWPSSPPTIASRMGITPRMGPEFIEGLPVGKFHGIGPATTARMNGHGIHTGADLRAQSLDFLQRNFGKAGAFYYWISRGVDERPVRADRVRKSVGAENTFLTDLFALGEARDALRPIIVKVWGHCEATGTG